jgi:hypothetical protein
MQPVLVLASLAAIVSLSGVLIYAVTRLTAAHKAERAATDAQAKLQRDLFEAQAAMQVQHQTEAEFRAAHATLATAYDDQALVLAGERERAARAERQRDDLIRQLAAKQDPAALVASINAELATLAKPPP